jgi:hypothetical protein
MEKKKNINIYHVHILTILEKEVKLMENLEIDSNKIKTIKELKYYLIDKYKKKNFCPCQLIISEFLGYGIFYSNLNEFPEKLIKDGFPDNNIYININADKNCDCGFQSLNNMSKIEIYENFMDKLKNLIIKYESIINDKNKQIKDLEEINDELLINLDNRIKKNREMNYSSIGMDNIVKFNQYDDNINFEEFYDVIINIKSIKHVNKGWDIKMSEAGKLRFEEYKNLDALIIGIIGNSNKGKSFLLSKISKINLPNGTNIRTEGLSIKYPELKKYKNRKIILLDSEGLEAPFLFEEYEKRNEMSDLMLKEKAREKLITEFFLQNFIMNNSDILITVVGLLTFQEQKFLNKIKGEISKLKSEKSLFVIHNLMTYTTKEQVKKYINNTLMNSATFELIKTTLITTKISSGEEQVEYFYEKNSKIRIIHLIFANEGSEAGNFYNQFALDFIENSYQQITNIKPFDVFENLKERFIDLSNILFENNSDYPLMTKKDFLDYSSIVSKRKIGLKNNREITLKRYYIDELGFSSLRNSGFNPCYNYYIKNDTLILRMEAPGNVKISCDYKISEKYHFIEIRGVKNMDKEPVNTQDNIYNGREFGEFLVEIPLMIYLENKKPKIEKVQGVYIIKYQIKEDTNNIIEYKEDDEDI